MGHIDERHTSGLRQNWRSVSRMTEVDRPGVEGLQKLGPCREADPLCAYAEASQIRRKRPAQSQQIECSGFLKADSDHVRLALAGPGTASRDEESAKAQ